MSWVTLHDKKMIVKIVPLEPFSVSMARVDLTLKMEQFVQSYVLQCVPITSTVKMRSPMQVLDSPP